MTDRDQSQDSTDITVFQLAEQVAGGNPCSDAGAREIAQELMRVRPVYEAVCAAMPDEVLASIKVTLQDGSRMYLVDYIARTTDAP